MDLKSLVRPVARIGTFLVITVTASANSVAGQHNEFRADLFPTPPGGMAVSDFVDRETPGNVGVALSGGGSRALSAGMGQLRALKYLMTNDLPLLEQTKALSTVSGGSWVGVPFSYLGNSAVSDNDYLNLYEDPSDLVPTYTPGYTLAQTLDEMPPGNIGANINKAFSAPAIALQALWLRLYGRVPTYMLWQTVIGLHLLSPYGLFLHGRNLAPIDSYSYDQTTLEDLFDLPGQNPDLAGIPVHLLNNYAPSRLTRPYQICNSSMFLKTTDSNSWRIRPAFEFLAPVQSTPFFTGILGSPRGFDNNGQQPGGGGVSSFAFNSRLLALDGDPGDTATIGMPRTSSSLALPIGNHRPFSLMDAVGTSSAFYASMLQNLFTGWEENSRLYLDTLNQYGEESLRWTSRYLTKDATDRIRKELDLASLVRTKGRSTSRLRERRDFLGQGTARLQDGLHTLGIRNLVPAYRYWPITDADPQAHTKVDRFADGGDLENTGVNALLSYADIDTIIAFVNSVTALQPSNGDDAWLIDDDDDHTIHTNIEVDSQIPPLFGYQPYDDTSGTYVLYEGAANPDYPQGMHSQSFPAADFDDFLLGLWGASGDGRTSCPNFPQEMPVLENEWFSIAPRETVSVLWVYTNFSQTWFDELSPDVQQLFQSKELEDFPHYSTLDTGLSPTQVNLLANLAAWCVAGDQNRQAFVDLYEQIP